MKTKQSQYKNDGFLLHSKPILPSDIVADAVAGMDAIRRGDYDTGRPPYESPWNPGDSEDVLCKIEMPQLASKGVMELVSHPAIGALAAEITGAEMVQVWWVQLLYKPPSKKGVQAATNVGMHQDFHYWKNHWENGSELFTAWVALSDVTPQAGSMHFVRGSHRWGLSENSDFFEQDIEAQRANIHIPAGESWHEVESTLAPGSLSFHDCLTWHGSGPNLSDAPRRSFAIHLRTEKSRTINGIRQGLTEFVDQTWAAPVIFGEKMAESMPAM